jgi:hypothetical protein
MSLLWPQFGVLARVGKGWNQFRCCWLCKEESGAGGGLRCFGKRDTGQNTLYACGKSCCEPLMTTT